MTKKIVTLSQLPEGSVNSKTGLSEKPAWQVGFDDQSNRTLFKADINTYLSMGYGKTVENFRRGEATTTSGSKASFWIVVFQDYEVRLQTSLQIMDTTTEGHQRHTESQTEEPKLESWQQRKEEATAQ